MYCIHVKGGTHTHTLALYCTNVLCLFSTSSKCSSRCKNALLAERKHGHGAPHMSPDLSVEKPGLAALHRRCLPGNARSASPAGAAAMTKVVAPGHLITLMAPNGHNANPCIKLHLHLQLGSKPRAPLQTAHLHRSLSRR